jgi:hypothetical protein
MDNIRTYGLMTKAERTQGNVVAASRGAVFGDGIYTANNCKNFSNFGPAGELRVQVLTLCVHIIF